MRGLKLLIFTCLGYARLSHLLQMRGLKHVRYDALNMPEYVASFTDAWIETIKVKETGTGEQSHLLQMRGLKLVSLVLSEPVDASRIFYRCVD